MIITDSHEIQALISYHATTIVEVIADSGIRPSKLSTLIITIDRMLDLAKELAKYNELIT